ncbi:WD40 repeat domain-containing protein [Pseudoalteromonas xiamenensis]|uniref:WD40 repeat domain-containing protein n=1 Tax=Pseudoalteromonas xiamenensis TaxID=882626 RepID=UPI0035EA0686
MRNLMILFSLIFLMSCDGKQVEKVDDAFGLVNEQVIYAAFSADSQSVLLYTQSKNLELWDLSNRTKRMQLEFSQIGEVARAFLLTHQKTKIVVGGEQRLSFWSVETGQLEQYFTLSGADPLARIASIAMSPNDEYLSVGMTDGSIVLLSFKDKSQRLFKPHSSEVAYLIWDADSRRVMSAGFDGVVSTWLFSDATVLSEFHVEKRVTTLAATKTLDTAFVSDALHDQRYFDVRSGHIKTTLSYPERFRWFREGLLLEERPYIVTTSSKSKLSIWSKETGKELGSWFINASGGEALVLDIIEEKPGTILTVSSDGIVERWQVDALVQE